MNLKTFFSSEYMLSSTVTQLSWGDKIFGLAGVVLLVLCALVKYSIFTAPSPLDGKVRQKFFNLFLTVGLWQTIWVLLRFQNVRFFGTHLVGWLSVVVGFVWLAVIFWDILRNYSKQKTEWEKEQVKLKYLPK